MLSGCSHWLWSKPPQSSPSRVLSRWRESSFELRRRASLGRWCRSPKALKNPSGVPVRAVARFLARTPGAGRLARWPAPRRLVPGEAGSLLLEQRFLSISPTIWLLRPDRVERPWERSSQAISLCSRNPHEKDGKHLTKTVFLPMSSASGIRAADFVHREQLPPKPGP
jgi:hypothetical protein